MDEAVQSLQRIARRVGSTPEVTEPLLWGAASGVLAAAHTSRARALHAADATLRQKIFRTGDVAILVFLASSTIAFFCVQRRLHPPESAKPEPAAPAR
ncbi:hypothetical protein M885DRAFT_538834 [Pelagophyceae sp. CCMP2097]|nr:hypothetical protein M885DRAFT_538834 [Pelagophyceae sp. CCMP2097]|mmetsp:Transcript_32873/g.110747  ORF Transcript_32873/g.110747 Transcript_32873/m.110747 type:complete len:98 (-) Transcript_32873:20-313(-)